MSGLVMGLVWELPLVGDFSRGEKYILLAYADYSDQGGKNIFPSIDLICAKTGYTDRAVQKTTRTLETLGYLVRSGYGPSGTNRFYIPLHAIQGGVKISPLPKSSPPPMSKSSPLMSESSPEESSPPLMSESSPEESSPEESSPEGTGSIRLIDDDSESNNKKEIINQSEPDFQKFPPISKILENLPMILGDTLRLADLPANTSAYSVLAWTAKIYQDLARPGSKLQNPCGLLRARLKAQEKRKLHLENLPDGFLNAIGLHIDRPQEQKPINVLDDLPDYEAERAEVEREKSERLASIPDSVRDAWSMALETMREEMARSQFETWVAPTIVIGWDGETLEIGARSTFAVRWLNTNLAEIAPKVMAQIGLECSVEFCVAEGLA